MSLGLIGQSETTMSLCRRPQFSFDVHIVVTGQCWRAMERVRTHRVSLSLSIAMMRRLFGVVNLLDVALHLHFFLDPSRGSSPSSIAIGEGSAALCSRLEITHRDLGNLHRRCTSALAGLVAAPSQADPAVRLSAASTTRGPRPESVDGRDYHFVGAGLRSDARPRRLESAEVHELYGTSRTWAAERIAAGEDIVPQIDWQGAQQVRMSLSGAIGIFVLRPSMAQLEARDRRASDSAEVIARRLAAAREEIAHVAESYDVIINERFDEAVRDLVVPR